ncbi:MAG: hypothetical protein ACRDF9_02175 [Candidatus Limnocylindria bacterium]
MSEAITFIDSSDVREGRLDELKAAINEMVELVESNEPRPIAYNVYLNENSTRMTVVQVHPDSASMELHMKLAGSVFRRFVELITLTTMDIYGTPSHELLEQIRRKVQMLGNATVAVHQLHAGFARLAREKTSSR